MTEQSSIFARAAGAFGWGAARSFARRKIVTALKSQPEPLSLGCPERGRQFIAGHFMVDGYMVDAGHQSPWNCASPSQGFEHYMHSFFWLDDVLALPQQSARKTAQAWLGDWIGRYGAAQGTGWQAEVTGARVLRWVHHAVALMRGLPEDQCDRYLVSLAQQSQYLARHWSRAPAGKARFEALCGLLSAALALEGVSLGVPDIIAALQKEADATFEGAGSIPSRNAEELLDIAVLLMWSRQAAAEGGHDWPAELNQHISHCADVLRVLRHSDGGLVRMQGAGRSAEGRLDAVLALVKPTRDVHGRLGMGFGRLSSGRTSVIMDCATPPKTPGAHASTLAFELCSGRRQIIVNMGHGRGQDRQWLRSCRASAGHSGALIAGQPSSALSDERSGKLALKTTIKRVPTVITRDTNETALQAEHDGYLERFGLIHQRSITLSSDGSRIFGLDSFITPDDKIRATFDRALAKSEIGGMLVELRFHLHPECQAVLDAVQRVVTIELPSHEMWVLRAPVNTSVRLEPGFYLSEQKIAPRSTSLITISRRINVPNIQLDWRIERIFYRNGRATRDTLTDLGPMSFLGNG